MPEKMMEGSGEEEVSVSGNDFIKIRTLEP